MQSLVAGANLKLPSSELSLIVQAASEPLAQLAGLVWLGFDGQHRACSEPHYLHSPNIPAIQAQPEQRWALKLDALPANLQRLQLCLYRYGAAGPVGQLHPLRLELDGIAQYEVPLAAQPEAAMLILEFYRRDQGWRVRALAEGSAYGLSALGRRLGLALNEQSPDTPASPQGNEAGADSRWSGSAFAVDPWHALTCQHVIEQASSIELVSFSGRRSTQLVIADATNDLALLKFTEPFTGPIVPFRAGPGCQLGEAITSLGFPLSGVTGSGLQVTQGCVSGLFGRHDDCRWLQFTAPIQPGSSGGPLFDGSGLVSGIVTSSVTNAQNLNFAIKTPLILAFLEAAGLEPERHLKPLPTIATPELIRRQQAGVWRVECQA